MGKKVLVNGLSEYLAYKPFFNLPIWKGGTQMDLINLLASVATGYAVCRAAELSKL